MKKISQQILIPTIITIVLMTLTLVIFTLYEGSKAITAEATSRLEHMAETATLDFNSILSEVTLKVDAIEDYIKAEIDTKRLDDDDYMAEFTESIKPFMKNIAISTQGNDSSYIHFDPDYTDKAYNVYYKADKNDYVLQPTTPKENFVESRDDMVWYFVPKKTKTNYFTDPYDWDGTMLITYAKPIIINGRFIAVAGMDFLFDDIKNLVLSEKVYDTGYAYLVNNDNKLIVHKELEGNTSKLAETLKNSKSGYTEDEEKFFGYSTLLNGWKYIISVPKSEVLSGLNILITSLIIISIVSLAVVILIILLITSKIVKPIKEVSIVADRVAENDLTTDVDKKLVNRKDEIGVLAKSFEKMIESLRTIIDNMQDSSKNINDSSADLASVAEETSATAEELSAQVNSITHSAENAAANVEEVNSGVEEVAASAQAISKAAAELNEQSNDTNSSALRGVNSINGISSTVKNAVTKSKKTEEDVKLLEEKSNKIGEIVDAISSITEQTKLLALNAAIEAARAGEAGKGFAVVADEIRKLAEESRKATEEIEAILKEIQSSTKNVNTSTEDTVVTIKEIDDEIKKISDEFNSILEKVQLMRSSIENMSASSEQQSASAEEMSSAMDSVARIVNQISEDLSAASISITNQAEGAQQTSASSEELASLSESFAQLIDKFKLR
ncbi:MAG: methyl-accepting chemotaxis protein [Oceanotoga sp.]|uniref:methyl-accepting chemotaxis protein n=1 Tax=Oceanotoga sp. TaxID=2108366 RepID=UPI00264C4E63|nr:methyl-accepting chemotaxis protein [Oceanotoga sp.]MDN5341693.1 methyl-accepting chemotaxis protein [Oceanotoga sp.]